MTLGSSGGALQPLTRDELLALPPAVDLITLGRAFAVTEPVIREMRRQGQLAEMGIRVLKLGAQYRVPLVDILRTLGFDESAAEYARKGGADAA